MPSGWFSIWDDNAISSSTASSFKYYRYKNEFVGDVSNYSASLGIYPNDVVVKVSSEIAYELSHGPNPPPTCPPILSIPFPPTPRFSGMDNYTNEQINIFPNPVSNLIINIESKTSKIKSAQLMDISGSLLMEKQYEISNVSQEVVLDRVILPGIYVLKIIDNKNISTNHKIIVE